MNDLSIDQKGIYLEKFSAVNKLKSRAPIIAGVALCAFVVGMAVATYKVFPYNQLHYVKQLVFGKSDAAKISLQTRETLRHQVYYLDKKSFFESQHTHVDVVMIGDSIIDGAEWNELLPDVSLANRGIAGDDFEGILNRMDSIDSLHAKKAFIMSGYNDLRKSRPVNEVFHNYKMIIEHLLANGTQPYIQSTILVGNGLLEWNNEIMELNTRLQNYAAEKHLVFIDLNTRLAKDGKLNPMFTRDGIHLNGAAYRLIAQTVASHLN